MKSCSLPGVKYPQLLITGSHAPAPPVKLAVTGVEHAEIELITVQGL